MILVWSEGWSFALNPKGKQYFTEKINFLMCFKIVFVQFFVCVQQKQQESKFNQTHQQSHHLPQACTYSKSRLKIKYRSVRLNKLRTIKICWYARYRLCSTTKREKRKNKRNIRDSMSLGWWYRRRKAKLMQRVWPKWHVRYYFCAAQGVCLCCARTWAIGRENINRVRALIFNQVHVRCTSKAITFNYTN